MITFRPLARSDLEQLTGWLNAPHVAAWWAEHATGIPTGAPAVTVEQVAAEYGPGVDAGGPTHHLVIVVDGIPVGMIQWYRLADEPEYAAAIGEVDGQSAGIDVLIGDPARVGHGVGSRAITTFVEELLADYPELDRTVAGPATTNERSIRAFTRAGFRWIRDAAVPDEPLPEHVMVRRADAAAGDVNRSST